MKKIEPYQGIEYIVFPIDPRLSENGRLIRRYRSDRFISSTDYRDAKEALALKMSIKWRHVQFKPKTKTKVGIYVYRKDYKSDVQNLIKGILDAVASAIGVDDRYFSVRVDWDISDKPHVCVGVTQSDN